MITQRERFFGFQKGNNNYAPMTIGAPAYTSNVDYSVFKKNAAEKVQLAVMKAEYERRKRKQ